MRVAIRADGSTEIGYGHLYRSNTIATQLLRRGHSVTYLTTTPESVSTVCSDQVQIVTIENSKPDTVQSNLRKFSPDIVYTDIPEIPFDLQRKLRDVYPLGIFLGSARHKVCCDILVNGHLYAEEENYEWAGDEPAWCLGSQYLPLREPFPELAARNVDCLESPEAGIILMGGTDPHNLTPAVITAFDSLNLDVTVIAGPGNKNQDEIEAAAGKLDGKFKVVRDPDNLPELMFNADIAVSGFGTTVYELMATRTPFVGITRTELEAETARRVNKYIDIPTFGRDFDHAQLAQSLYGLLTTPERRSQLQNEFESHIDGKGSARIAEQIELITSK